MLQQHIEPPNPPVAFAPGRSLAMAPLPRPPSRACDATGRLRTGSCRVRPTQRSRRAPLRARALRPFCSACSYVRYACARVWDHCRWLRRRVGPRFDLPPRRCLQYLVVSPRRFGVTFALPPRSAACSAAGSFATFAASRCSQLLTVVCGTPYRWLPRLPPLPLPPSGSSSAVLVCSSVASAASVASVVLLPPLASSSS